MNLCGLRKIARERLSVATVVHLDVDVGRRGRDIPKRQCTVQMQQRGDPVSVADDPGDVAGGGERPDLQRSLGVVNELLRELGRVDVPICILADDDHIGDRLTPREFVGVVFEGADEHHGTFIGRDHFAEAVTVLQTGGDAQPEDPDQLVDRCGAARSGKDDDRFLVTTDGITNDRPGILSQSGGLQTGAAGLRMRVGVPRQHLIADEVLDETQCAAGCRVVGVRHPPGTVWARHHLVVTDHGLADPSQ